MEQVIWELPAFFMQKADKTAEIENCLVRLNIFLPWSAQILDLMENLVFP